MRFFMESGNKFVRIWLYLLEKKDRFAQKFLRKWTNCPRKVKKSELNISIVEQDPLFGCCGTARGPHTRAGSLTEFHWASIVSVQAKVTVDEAAVTGGPAHSQMPLPTTLRHMARILVRITFANFYTIRHRPLKLGTWIF